MGFYAEYRYSFLISKDTSGISGEKELAERFAFLYGSLWEAWGDEADEKSAEAYRSFKEDPSGCRNPDGSWQATITTGKRWQFAGTRIELDVVSENARRTGIVYEVAQANETTGYLWCRTVYGPDGKVWHYAEEQSEEDSLSPTLRRIAEDNAAAYLVWKAAAGE